MNRYLKVFDLVSSFTQRHTKFIDSFSRPGTNSKNNLQVESSTLYVITICRPCKDNNTGCCPPLVAGNQLRIDVGVDSGDDSRPPTGRERKKLNNELHEFKKIT